MDIPFVASLKYRDRIDASCKDLYDLCGVDYFIMYLQFKNGQIFVLSNIYDHLIDYYHNGMFKHDSSTSRVLFTKKNFYVCDNHKGMSEIYSSLLQEKYSVHRTFYKKFPLPDLDIIIGAATKEPVTDKLRLYKKISKDIDNFAIRFIQENLSILKNHNPEFKKLNYLQEPQLLKQYFNQSFTYGILSQREIDCLTLTAKGYTSEESAGMLQLGKCTVEDYKKSILKKLHAVNMPNAVYVAMNEKLIEKDSKIIQPIVKDIAGFRNLKIRS